MVNALVHLLFPLLMIVGVFLYFIISAARRKVYLQVAIVIIIPALLAWLLLPCFFAARPQAQLAACESNLKTIAIALEEYRVQQKAKTYPENLSQLAPAYLKEIPRCPSSNEIYTYQTTKDPKDEIIGFVVRCPKPDRHAPMVTDLFYSSEKGLQIIR